ncbi:MAG: nitronate monooxygenase [Thermomicrobiales bacterium]
MSTVQLHLAELVRAADRRADQHGGEGLMLHTRLCDLLGIEHPIISAPMAGIAGVDLVAAVSGAGGFGVLGATVPFPDPERPEEVRRQIRAVRERTDRPFGVGIVPGFPGSADVLAVALEEQVAAVTCSFADPEPVIAAAHAAGVKVLAQVQTLERATRAARAGADVITAQGTDAGGHCGLNGTLAFVPAVRDAVASIAEIPVVAAGGIADGRGLAAVLLLGADGAWMGTRFCATPEVELDELSKSRIVVATVDDTVRTMAYDVLLALPAFGAGVASRVLRNTFLEEWDGREPDLLAAREALLAEAEAAGEVDAGAVWAGHASGLIHGIEPAAEIVRRVVAEAEGVLRSRVGQVLR